MDNNTYTYYTARFSRDTKTREDFVDVRSFKATYTAKGISVEAISTGPEGAPSQIPFTDAHELSHAEMNVYMVGPSEVEAVALLQADAAYRVSQAVERLVCAHAALGKVTAKLEELSGESEW